jgi:hypothetical protein
LRTGFSVLEALATLTLSLSGLRLNLTWQSAICKSKPWVGFQSQITNGQPAAFLQPSS